MVRSSNYRRREPRVNAPFLPRPTGTEANEERRQATLPAMPPGLRSPSAMPDIVLTTLNAKYIHAAFGLRYLMANLGELQPRACLVEFDINQRPLDIAEVLLAREPCIIGFGVYIWNVAETLEVVAAIKRVSPQTTIVLGGPEV